MKRKIIGEKEGFRITWAEDEKNKENHKWWHWFFRKTEMIFAITYVNGQEFVKNRTWITTCKKCDYSLIQIRELWLPGEPIIGDAEDNKFDASVELAKTMKELNELSKQ